MYEYVNQLEDYVVPTSVEAETLTHGDKSTAVVDGIFTANEQRNKYAYIVVNKSPDKSQQLTIDFKSLGVKTPSKVNATVLEGRTPDDYNDLEHPDRVVPQERILKVKDNTITLSPHSQ